MCAHLCVCVHVRDTQHRLRVSRSTFLLPRCSAPAPPLTGTLSPLRLPPEQRGQRRELILH